MKFIIIHPEDNAAVAIEEIKQGETLDINGQPVTIKNDIKPGHKFAILPIKQNQNVIKYGYEIGHASANIEQGEWIHSHNLKTNLSDIINYSYNPVLQSGAKNGGAVPTFMGYKRKNGKVGTRNELWIINTVGCVNSAAEKIAKICNDKFKGENFDGAFTYTHPYGCSQLGDDLDDTRHVLSGLIKHPNAGAVLVLGLGCENNQLSSLIKQIGAYDPERLSYFNSQEVGDEIDEGVNRAEKLFEAMSRDKREEVPISELVIGVKCGGSDALSGITANPLVGRITDMLTQYGGSVIQTEVPEMFGAEQQLMNRAKNEKVYKQIVAMINNFKEYFKSNNQPIYENPSPGNKEGGITTLEEKSLGAIQKGGKAVINQALDYCSPITEKGLALMNAPGNDGVSSTAMTAGGAAILLFTTGRGTPLGFPVPTIKISTNSSLYERKKTWIDFNAGVLVEGKTDMNEASKNLLDYIIAVASGKERTRNEINGFKEIALWKKGVTL
jgi:altronate hydrolase